MFSRRSWIPALAAQRRMTLHRVRDTSCGYFPTHFGGRFSENAFGPSI